VGSWAGSLGRGFEEYAPLAEKAETAHCGWNPDDIWSGCFLGPVAECNQSLELTTLTILYIFTKYKSK
jgi:hypothetical protein